MVAPRDVGQAAAQRLSSPVSDVGIRYIEGPKHYSPADVAQAFAVALGRPVEPAVTPREKWTETFLRWGFSKPAAASYTRMIEVSVDNGFDSVDDPWRGSTSLGAYVHELVARAKEEAR